MTFAEVQSLGVRAEYDANTKLYCVVFRGVVIKAVRWDNLFDRILLTALAVALFVVEDA